MMSVLKHFSVLQFGRQMPLGWMLATVQFSAQNFVGFTKCFLRQSAAFICLQGPRSNKDNIAPSGYNLGTNVGRKRNAKFKDYLLLSFNTESE